MLIEAPGLPLSHLLKRLLIFVLVGFQKGDDLSAFERELRQAFCRHLISIYHHPLHQQRRVLVLLTTAGQPSRAQRATGNSSRVRWPAGAAPGIWTTAQIRD